MKYNYLIKIILILVLAIVAGCDNDDKETRLTNEDAKFLMNGLKTLNKYSKDKGPDEGPYDWVLREVIVGMCYLQSPTIIFENDGFQISVTKSKTKENYSIVLTIDEHISDNYSSFSLKVGNIHLAGTRRINTNKYDLYVDKDGIDEMFEAKTLSVLGKSNATNENIAYRFNGPNFVKAMNRLHKCIKK